jgi:hypothetical protein
MLAVVVVHLVEFYVQQNVRAMLFLQLSKYTHSLYMSCTTSCSPAAPAIVIITVLNASKLPCNSTIIATDIVLRYYYCHLIPQHYTHTIYTLCTHANRAIGWMMM